jgi:hypothetical protein
MFLLWAIVATLSLVIFLACRGYGICSNSDVRLAVILCCGFTVFAIFDYMVMFA